MRQTPLQSESASHWKLPSWAINALVTIMLTVIAYAVASARADGASATEIAAIKEHQAEQDKRIDRKLSQEEFQQFTRGLDERLKLIQANTDLLVRNQRQK